MSKKKRNAAPKQPTAKKPNLYDRMSSASSKLRFSLTFRIALHYAWQLMRTFALHAFIVSLCLVIGMTLTQRTTFSRIRALPPDGPDNTYTQLLLQNGDLDASWSAKDAPVELGDLIALNVKANARSLFSGTLTVIKQTKDDTGLVTMHVNLATEFRVWLLVMAGVLVSDLLRMLYFMRHRNRLDQSVLAPIRNMTALAATLSANNLSNRINVAGTKDELKELAVVINSMLDRIERSYNSQKQFVSDASHELRTPIAVIQGYVNMLQRWGKDDQSVLDEGLGAISQETASMKELVENLLFLARHDKKTLLLEMETFDPCDVVTELHREAQLVTPNDHFELLSADHCTIEADRNMVKQVMRILLDNAVKYTPEGGTISMGVYATPTGCTLVMKDNGAGISGDDLPKIFDRFYRSDTARKSEGGGHGLGLSIARIIVVAHGGKIRVRSKLGEGTVFSVMLPSKQTAAQPTPESPAEPTPTKKPRRLRKHVDAA